MELMEKVAYLKGLMNGLELEADKKETKVFNAIVDVLDELASTLTDVVEETDEMSELIDVLDQDLGDVEEVVFGDDEDDECCCGDEEETYEITCPTCGNTIYIDESMLDEGEMKCPNCGQELEFDLDIDEDEDDDHDHDHGCGCGCGCDE